jgi:hypothetical protein
MCQDCRLKNAKNVTYVQFPSLTEDDILKKLQTRVQSFKSLGAYFIQVNGVGCLNKRLNVLLDWPQE